MTPTLRWLGLGLLLTTAALAACGDDSGARPEHEAEEHDDQDEHAEEEEGLVELSPEAVARIGLLATPAVPRPLAVRRATTGRIGFDEERVAHVSPRVGGRLVRVPASLGESVAAGETLAVLDSVELGEAKAAYLRARARGEVTRAEHERQRALHADRIVSEQEMLAAEAVAREAAADLAAHREALRLLGLDDRAIERLSWSESEDSLVAVRAPFAGRVVEREATLGEIVSPEDRLFTLADLSEVWLWIDLYERDLAHVRQGDRVEVRLDAWPETPFGGELTYVADQLDPETRTVRARVDLANPTGRLKPGMFARVLLATGEAEAESVLAVPREAVQRDGTRSIVFVRTAPGRFERREVELGRIGDGAVEVLAGLAPGDEVVTEGAFLLKSQLAADQLGGHHH